MPNLPNATQEQKATVSNETKQNIRSVYYKEQQKKKLEKIT